METDPFREAFAQRLRAAMQRAGLTESALAHALGIKPQNVQHWTHGRALPQLPMLAAIGKTLSTSIDYLLLGESGHPEKKEPEQSIQRTWEMLTQKQREQFLQMMAQQVAENRAIYAELAKTYGN